MTSAASGPEGADFDVFPPQREEAALDGGHDDLIEPADDAVASTDSDEPSVRQATETGFRPLASVNSIGDEGGQPEILMNLGPLTTGVSDTELEFCSVGPYEVRAAATRGFSHRYSGTPRQDMFCVGADDDWLVFAIADGVSAGRHSHVAAETAARAACKVILEQTASIGDIDWVRVCARVSRRILDEAVIRKIVDLSALADTDAKVRAVRAAMSTTTVVTALRCTPDESGCHEGWLAVLAGDSGAYLLNSGALTSLAGGKDGAAAISSTSVDPLPGASKPEVVSFSLRPGEAVVIVSDGLGDPIGDGSGQVGEELARRWATPPGAAQFFEDVNFFRRSYDDDRSAVVAWLPVRDNSEDGK
jgi:serine/threonine protein phosphatase PrpC